MFVAAACITCVPTSVEPVNEIFATRGSAISALAVVDPGPGSTLSVPSGQAALVEDLGDRERGERGLRGRLHDGGVAAGERRGDLPAGDHRREVPRRDQRAHADGLAQGDVDARRHDRDRLARDLVGGAAPVLEDVRGDVDLGACRRDRLAAVARLEPASSSWRSRISERRLREQTAALAGGHARPRALVERAGGDVDGARASCGPPLATSAIGARGRRLDHLAGRAVGGRDTLAAEHQQFASSRRPPRAVDGRIVDRRAYPSAVRRERRRMRDATRRARWR